MAHIKHFIITQFNLRLWSKDKQNRSTYTEEWLSKRFVLFDTYCFPSMQNQTNPNFVWLCLFDKSTPECYLEEIKKYQEKCPQLYACFLDEQDTADWLGYTQDQIQRHLEENDEYIVTTNLDNDDAIHLKMVETVALEINKNPQAILYSFVYGYQYFTELGIILKMKYPHNHFLSLVEKNTPDFKTIKSLPHAKARKHYKTIDLKTEPYWVEFVHNSNVNNDLRITSRIKYYPVFKTVSLKSFGMDITLTSGNNIINTLVKMPYLFTITAVRKLKKKLGKKKNEKR